MRYAIVTAIVFAVLVVLTWLTGQYLRATSQAELRQVPVEPRPVRGALCGNHSALSPPSRVGFPVAFSHKWSMI